VLKVRKPEPGDRKALTDAAEAHIVVEGIGESAETWINGNTVIYEDVAGPVLAVLCTNAARLDLQFFTPYLHKRNAQALSGAFWGYVSILQERGVQEVICNTRSDRLSKFLVKRLHFRLLSGYTYSLRIK
jgi:hypothetical protein